MNCKNSTIFRKIKFFFKNILKKYPNNSNIRPLCSYEHVVENHGNREKLQAHDFGLLPVLFSPP